MLLSVSSSVLHSFNKRSSCYLVGLLIVYGSHSLTDVLLDSCHTLSHLVLKELTNGTDPSVTEMVDIIECTDTVAKTDVIRNHSVDIVYYKVLGHELALSLIENISELLSDVSLLAVSSYILDDLTENAYTNTLVDRCALEVEVLKILLGEGSSDELLAVNSSVTYYLMSILGISDMITDLDPGIYVASGDTCILDLAGKLC